MNRKANYVKRRIERWKLEHERMDGNMRIIDVEKHRNKKMKINVKIMNGKEIREKGKLGRNRTPIPNLVSSGEEVLLPIEMGTCHVTIFGDISIVILESDKEAIVISRFIIKDVDVQFFVDNVIKLELTAK
jgi:hypothetical protein